MKCYFLNPILLIGFVCLNTGTVFTYISAQTPYRYEPIIDVYHEPIPFQGNGKTYLTYELHISNANKWNYDMRIENIKIYDSSYSDNAPLKTYEGDLLSTCVPISGKKPVVLGPIGNGIWIAGHCPGGEGPEGHRGSFRVHHGKLGDRASVRH